MTPTGEDKAAIADMKAGNHPPFDIGTLRELAGDRAFARGQVYCDDGRVEILNHKAQRIVARVSGEQDYRTVLNARQGMIDGECSCRAFENWGFCKHMVATALAANAVLEKSGIAHADALAPIRSYLKGQGVDALVELITELAERDPGLLRRLELAAAVQADDKTLETGLRKAISAATRTGRFVDYRRAPVWASRVDDALDALESIASGARADIVVGLAEYAISRIEKAIDNIDDSDGHGGALLDRAQRVHLKACCSARPEPLALARNLFAREMQGGYDTFRSAAEHYSEALGETGLAEYRRLAAEVWETLPPRTGAARNVDEYSGDYYRLAPIMDFFAERDGDVEARIELRAKTLTSPWNYLEVAEFCREQGREEEALSRAEEGLWVFEDGRPDERLVLFAAELLEKTDRNEDAMAHLWRAFEKAPSLRLYSRLRELGDKSVRMRAVKFLNARIADGAPALCWGSPVDVLIRILIHEEMFDVAWITIRNHGAPGGVKESLAAASEKSHPREAFEAYAERVEELAITGGKPAYEEAAALIARMGNLRSEEDQAAYIVSLKERHGRKRNLMKLLD